MGEVEVADLPLPALAGDFQLANAAAALAALSALPTQLPVSLAAIHAGLDGNSHVTIHDYEGLDHGFADTFGARRDEEGGRLADRRTEEFFAKHVG